MIHAESLAAHRFLDGLEGIEIGGAAHNPFNIAHCRNVDFTDEMTTTFKNLEREEAGTPLPVDIVASGEKLPLADNSVDYVLHSHVLEHFWDPIGAINEWLRVLRPGGLVFMIVPHKERTFDAEKPRTTLAELIARHRGERTMPPGAGLHDHHSIWITTDVVELITYLALEIVWVEDRDDKVGNGFTVVFRKPGKLATAPITIDLGCGGNKRAGAIGVDRQSQAGVDIVCDVAREPLPFADDSVSSVYSNGLFHLIDDPIGLLREILRVAKPGATVEIVVPHAFHDASTVLGARQRFTADTWLEILASDSFAAMNANLTLREIVLLVPPTVLSDLQARGLPLDFSVRYFANVISRIGAIMTVNKPRIPGVVGYTRRVAQERA